MEQEVKEARCAHPPPFDNDDVIDSNQYVLHYHYQEEEDEDKEEEVKEAQCAHPPPLYNDNVIGTIQYLCPPKAELNTKTNPNGHHSVPFGFVLVFNSVHQKSKWSETVRTAPDFFIWEVYTIKETAQSKEATNPTNRKLKPLISSNR